MITKQEIRSVIERESTKGGFDFRDVSVEELRRQEREPHFQMRTNLDDRKTEIRYDSSYEDIHHGQTVMVIKDGAKHEINHHQYRGYHGCPRNLGNHVDLIYEPIMDVLYPQGFGSEDASYVSNCLEDTILHDDLHNGCLLDGISKFFQDVGDGVKKFTPFYESHVRLNMVLWGNKTQKKGAQTYFTHDEKERKKVLEAMQGFLEESGINSFKQDLSGKQIRDKGKIRDYVLNEKNWPKIAEAYAKNMSKLMQPSYAQSLMNHSGAGTKGRESEDASGEGNEFDRQMKARDFKRARVQRAYTSGKPAPSWIDSFDALDLLYESLAKKLTIKAETFTRQTSMPIFWYGSREFDPETDDFKHITLGAKESGELDIRKKRWHENMPLEVKASQRGFPRARFGLIDCSGTMMYSPSGSESAGSKIIIPWGDNSRYHYALLSWYGFLEYLRQNHLLNQSAVDLAGFSDSTVVGKGLLDAKKVALSPQFGNTTLDLDKVGEFFDGRGNLIFSISDGEIHNWGNIREEFIKQAGKHHYFHLQIGDRKLRIEDQPRMFQDLRNAGFYADIVSGNQDLADKTIDLTDKILRTGK